MLKTNETFYFLKVELGIDSCEEVAAVERLKHGPEYLWLWIRLALKYTNYNGVLCRRIGDKVLPLTAEDIEAEMKGGFSDVSIKDGVTTLIEANLIFINSNGFMQITGLVLSGDPLEPTLHKQNSNKTDIRPLSVGKDSKIAAYHRNYRKVKKDEEVKLLTAPENNTLTYAEIATKAKCSKQTVSNYIKNLGLENIIIHQGQKKLLPHNAAQYLICHITGKKVPQEVFDGLRFDGFDSLRQPSKPSNNRKNFDGSPSKKISVPSNESTENNDIQLTFDGFANANGDANLNANSSLIENKRNKDIDDEYINRLETVKPQIDLIDLFHIGFDREPTLNDISLLSNLYRKCDYSILLSQLKVAKEHNAQSMEYVRSCVSSLSKEGIVSAEQLPSTEIVDPDRDISKVMNMMAEDFQMMTPDQAEDIKNAIRLSSKYYTDIELLNALRILSTYKVYSGEAFRSFLGASDIDLIAADKEWMNNLY